MEAENQRFRPHVFLIAEADFATNGWFSAARAASGPTGALK